MNPNFLALAVCWLLHSLAAAEPPKFSQQTDGWLSAWPASTTNLREDEGTESWRPLVVAREDEISSSSSASTTVHWSNQWKVFGPLPADQFASDPLEAVGGIWQAVKQPDLRVVSELVDGAYVGWQLVKGTNPAQSIADQGNADQGDADQGEVDQGEVSQGDLTQGDTIRFGVNFTEMVNHQLLDAYFGQAGRSWKGWAVGTVKVDVTSTFALAANGLRGVYIDNESNMYMGDGYRSGMGRVPVHLAAGVHTFFVPIGGYDTEGSWDITLKEITSLLYEIDNDAMIPDAVDGLLAGSYGSIVVANALATALNDTIARIQVGSMMERSFSLPSIASGQIMPLALPLEVNYDYRQGKCENQIRVQIVAAQEGDILFDRSYSVRCRVFGQPYRFTFLDFDGSVQKAALYPPRSPCGKKEGCPLIFTTHGASVDSDSDAWTYAYRQQETSWILFPTNRRPFGYDWEGPGLMNGRFALGALRTRIPGLPESKQEQYKIDTSRRLYAGHSMGGHGCLVFSTLTPDFAIASACASGWIRRDLYVPAMHFTSATSRWDHVRSGLVQSSLDEYSVDVHLRNMVGIPTLLRMGTVDETVPSWGFRRVARMLNEYNGSPNFTKISEVASGGHWFDGIVDDDVIQPFLDEHLSKGERPRLPQQFVISSFNPATFQGKGGVKILQFDFPYRLASMKVRRTHEKSGEFWVFRTSNVKRFGFYRVAGIPVPTSGVRIDGQDFPSASVASLADASFCKDSSRKWKICKDAEWIYKERSPATYGPARQVFEQAPVRIYYSSGVPEHYAEAVHIANVMYYQGRYSLLVLPDTEFDAEMGDPCNLVILGTPRSNKVAAYVESRTPANRLVHFDGTSSRPSFSLYQKTGAGGTMVEPTHFSSPSHGITYLTPWSNSKGTGLAIIVAGNSVQSFRAIVRKMLPINSNLLMGDFAVVDAMNQKDLLAFGFWTNDWLWDDRIGFVDTFLL